MKKEVKDTEKNVMNEVSMDRYTEVNENQLNTSFDINTPYDILSNGKEHSVSLKELKIKAKYEYYAAPRVDNGIYLIALVDDYSQYNLLAGEANIIFEDMLHYTTVKTNMFNGISHPAIALLHTDNELEMLREYTYEDYRDRMD